MASTMARAAGLFMAICVLFGTGSSQSVPDGQVYTEVKKTLVQGFPGVLTCRFFGDPVAVYWEKGHDPDDMDQILVWYNGEVSGPRYDDRSCDIDENYSLIISNVSTVDAGRIYCKVSNYRGFLINNYTDVSVADTAIETISEEILQMGQSTYGVLNCTVRIKARRVSWKKGATSPANETLVVLENHENPAARSGLGYDEGMYNITENYSLIIKNVQVRHEGLYVCEVTDFDTGISFQSHTFAKVIAYPRKPFPTIQECMKTEQFGSQYCTLEATSEIAVTCEVTQYYPEINLFFLHGSTVVEPSEKMEWNNTDGTKNKTITIAARESKEPYTCVASNISGYDERRSTSVLLHDEETFISVLVIVLVCLAVFILFSLMAYFIWRRKHRHSDSNYTQVGQVELQYSHDKDVKGLTDKDKQALLERVNDASMKHYRRIYDLFDTKSTLQVERVINENKTALFDTEKMLNDWQRNPESTYHQYTKAMQAVISTKDTSDNAWPCNEELRWISHHLEQESMKQICKKLRITYKPEDADVEGNRYNSLREWRNKMAHENIEKKHNLLSSAIGSKKFRGLLPPLKETFISHVYKAELVDMAFNLLTSDLLPVAEALGVNATKFVSYRPSFQPSHLEIGTIDLLSKLLNFATVERQKFLDSVKLRNFFYNKIGKLTYRNVSTYGIVAYDMSYGELFAISEAMASTRLKAGVQALQDDTSKVPTQSEDDKGKKGAASEIPEDGKKEAMAFITEKVQALPGDTSKTSTQSENGKYEKGASSNMTHDSKKEEGTDIEKCEGEKPQAGLVESTGNQIPVPEKAVKDIETMDQRVVEISKYLVDLQRVLQLKDQDIADGLGSSHPITAHALFKIWKEKPRRSAFNYRAALAHELRGIQYPDLANEVIAGKYIKERTSLEFIQNMVQGLNQDQLRSLGKILELSGKDDQWHTRTPFDVITEQIYEWVAKWTKEMKKPANVVTASFRRAAESFKEVTPIDKIDTTSKKHRDLNDKLVEQGFLELAREIMIIELVE